MRNVRKKRLSQRVCVWWLMCVTSALAHDPGLSALSFRLNERNLIAQLTLARNDVAVLAPLLVEGIKKPITQQEFDAIRVRLEEMAPSTLEVSVDAQEISPAKTAVEVDDDGVRFHFTFPRPAGPVLRVRAAILDRLPRGHRQYVSVRDESDRVLSERVLSATDDLMEVPLDGAEVVSHSPSTFRGFLILGVEHIVTGYDHLIFLLGLLIVGGSFRAAVKVITAFTIAHSMTLALATLDLIRIPSRIVEPLIAVSIMYVGVENLFRRDLDKRWLLAFGFGLIHGCGFATVLKDLGVGRQGGGVAMPLFSFNLGVELGQVVIAALVLPCIWRLKQRPAFQPRYVPACSLLIALAGAYWLVERVLG